MEIKNTKIRKSLLVAAIVLGVGGVGSISAHYIMPTDAAPGVFERTNTEDCEPCSTGADAPLTDSGECAECEDIKDKKLPAISKDIPKEKVEKVEKVDPNREPKRIKELSTLNSAGELDTKVNSFLTDLMLGESLVLKTLVTENLDKLNGLYVSTAKVLTVGEQIEIDLGLSKETVSPKNIITYKGLAYQKGELNTAANDLAIVEYKDNKVRKVELFQLDYSINEIQHAISKTKILKKEEFNSLGEQKKNESNTHEYLTQVEWKGMALLASRDIIDNDMAPIFIVPNSSLKESTGDFAGTFYYVVTGILISSTENSTTLMTSEGKTIDLDFGDESFNDHKGKPVWLHIITNDGKVDNVEIQAFEGANITVQSAGILDFIKTATAEDNSKK